MKRFLFFAVLALVLLLAGAAVADNGTISGCAYYDSNANGACDDGERQTGVPVELYTLDENSLWEKCDATYTDEYGFFSFNSLTEGTYCVACALQQNDYAASTVGGNRGTCQNLISSDSFLLASGETIDSMDIALVRSAWISVQSYQDSNSNGLQDKKEKALAGVWVEAVQDGNTVAAGTTDSEGKLSLSVAPGSYVLRACSPDGYALTVKGEQSHFEGSGEDFSESDTLSFAEGENATVYAACCVSGSLSGKAFEDINNNGIMDEDEPGVAGVTLHIVGNNTGTTRDLTTDDTGLYAFKHLPGDTYVITADLPEGMLYAHYSKTGGDLRSIFTGSTVSRKFPVKKGANVTNKNVGLIQKGSISGIAFYDTNYNGQYDEGEPGYEGVTLEAIKINTGDTMDKTVTGKDGTFTLENLRAGEYRLRAILPDDGSIFSVTGDGTADSVNLFAQRSGRRENSVSPLTISSGAEVQAIVGVAKGASITGTVYQDDDYSGAKNGKEKVLSGISVRLLDEDGNEVATDTTGKKGNYEFTGIMPGTYTLQVQRKAGYGFSKLRPDEENGNWITVLQGEWGTSIPFEIEMGKEYSDINAGMLPSSTLSGVFYQDDNDNGQKEANEGGLCGTKVRLYSEEAEIDLTTEIAEDGSYFFDGIMPGEYTLTYYLPEYTELIQYSLSGETVSSDGLEITTKSFRIATGENATAPVTGGVVLGFFVGTVFHDSNANGVQDADENTVEEAEIILSSDNGMETVSALTAEDGKFAFYDLRPGTYSLTVILPEQYIFSKALEADQLNFACESEQTLDLPWNSLISRTDKNIGAVRPASLSGEIWLDENRDGEQADNESMILSVPLKLVDESTGLTVQTIVTTDYGFSFDAVRPGTYTVLFDLPEGCSMAADALSTMVLNEDGSISESGIQLTEGQSKSDVHTGLVAKTKIGGTVLLDSNGIQTPIVGTNISLYTNGSSSALQTVQTDESGAYLFEDLWPDDYIIVCECPNGTVFIRQDDSNYAPGTSVITQDYDTYGMSDSFTLAMGVHQLERNILLIVPAKVGDLAWLDENANGLIDAGEPILPDVKVRLLQNGTAVYETVTDAHGYYLFDNVYPGEYTLEAEAYPQLLPTKQVPALRIISTCLVSGDGTSALSESFFAESGTNNKDFDLGYVLIEGETIDLPEEPTKDWTMQNEMAQVSVY